MGSPDAPASETRTAGPLERAERERRALLTAALGFARLELRPSPPALDALKGWLNSWSELGAVLTGMSWALSISAGRAEFSEDGNYQYLTFFPESGVALCKGEYRREKARGHFAW